MPAFKDHFSAVAADYATYRPTYPPALADVLAAEAPARGLAWEVGCGTGQLTGDLAARFDRVIATDPAAKQLAQAAPHANVEYRVASAEASGLPDACADLVVAAQAAHWFDWPRFVAEAGRVAKPGALVALVTYNDMLPLGGGLDPALDAYREAVEPYWWPERDIVRDGYVALVMPWPAVAAPAFEMTARWTRAQLLGYLATWSATTRHMAAHGRAAFDALAARFAALWPDGQTRTIRWPLLAKLARR